MRDEPFRQRRGAMAACRAEVSAGLVAVLGMLLSAVAAPAQNAAAEGVGIVRPGDQVSVRIWREEDLSGKFTVDHNGDVVLPRLGIVPVGGRRADELQRQLRADYQDFVRHPAVEVTLLRRVGVHGEVRNPDLYMVDLTTTLRDLVAMAGGLTDQGDPNKIEIVRGGERVRVQRGGVAQFATMELQSGDQVTVGRRNWILLNPLAIISTATAVASLLLVAFR